MNSDNLPLFATCAPALELLVIEELKSLGFPSSSLQAGYRGVFVYNWTFDDIYRINYASRLASRVLLPLLHFHVYDKKSLYRHAMEIDWTQFLKERDTFAIDANVNHRELRNSLYAAQVVKDAICDQMRKKKGSRPTVQVQNPDIQINLFIQHQSAVLSFDTSGQPLHKRGYRQESVEAPLQETLAAAILQIAGYSKEDVFLDPCCGSGTFLIEAALMAARVPPGFLRKDWGFMRHPSFDSIKWLKARNLIDEKRIPLKEGHLFGIDRSDEAVRAARMNLKAAGFQSQVAVEQADFREFQPAIAPNLILTNPPHGKRLDEVEQLRPLYRALGDFIKKRSKRPGRGFIFTSSLELAKEVGLAAKKRSVLSNGGLDSRLLEFDVF